MCCENFDVGVSLVSRSSPLFYLVSQLLCSILNEYASHSPVVIGKTRQKNLSNTWIWWQKWQTHHPFSSIYRLWRLMMVEQSWCKTSSYPRWSSTFLSFDHWFPSSPYHGFSMLMFVVWILFIDGRHWCRRNFSILPIVLGVSIWSNKWSFNVGWSASMTWRKKYPARVSLTECLANNLSSFLFSIDTEQRKFLDDERMIDLTSRANGFVFILDSPRSVHRCQHQFGALRNV